MGRGVRDVTGTKHVSNKMGTVARDGMGRGPCWMWGGGAAERESSREGEVEWGLQAI